MNYKKFFKDISIIFVITIIGSILSYLIRMIFARQLTISEYGLFYSVIGLFAFFAIFRSLGTSEALIHFIPKYLVEKKLNKVSFAIKLVFYIQFIFGAIVSILFFVFAKWIAINFIHIESAYILIRINSVTYFIIGFAELLKNVFRGYQKNILSSMYDSIRMLFVLLLVVIILKLNVVNVTNIMGIWLSSYIILLIIYLFFFFKDIKLVKSKFDKLIIKDLKKYSIPLVIGMGAQIIFSKTDVLILTFLRGVTEVAYYEVVNPASKVITFLFIPIIFVIFPTVSKLFHEKDINTIKTLLQGIYSIGLFLVLPILIILMFLSKLVIMLIFGSKYLLTSNALVIMFVGAFFLMFADINFNVLSGMGEIKKKTKILYTIVLFNIIGDIILIPLLGYLGAVIITSISYFLLWLLGFIIIKKKINFTFKMISIKQIIKVIR